MDYWKECIICAFDDAGIKATDEQIERVAGDVEVAHENYGVSQGYEAIPNPLTAENEKLKQELKKEQEKTICPACKGKGVEHTYGGTFMSTSDCYKCGGSGFIY